MTQPTNVPKKNAERAGSVFSPGGTAARLAVAWLWVGIPLAIGVAVTVKSSLPLFQSAPAVTAPAK